MNWMGGICTLNLTAIGKPRVQPVAWPTRERLARGFVLLERIQKKRSNRSDLSFATSSENQVIWRGLLELELQEIDEQIDRLAAGCERLAGERSPACSVRS
jgi:hypothetical protein